MADRMPPKFVGNDIHGPTIAAFTITLKEEFSSLPHSHPRGQLIGCTRGAVTISTEAGAWIVPAGHAIWIPPDQLHGGQSFGSGAGWTAYFAPAACGLLPERPRTVVVPPLLREAILRAASWQGDCVDEARQRIADLIVDETGRLPAEKLELPMPQDQRLRQIAQAFLSRPDDNRTLDNWASWAGLSSRTLSRRFPLETGLNFSEWRQKARLIRALELLADGYAVTTIALDLGYNSVSGFIALFRKAYGVTPSAHPIRNAGKKTGVDTSD